MKFPHTHVSVFPNTLPTSSPTDLRMSFNVCILLALDWKLGYSLCNIGTKVPGGDGTTWKAHESLWLRVLISCRFKAILPRLNMYRFAIWGIMHGIIINNKKITYFSRKLMILGKADSLFFLNACFFVLS